MKKLIPVLLIFTLVFLSGCGMLLDTIAGEDFDVSRLERESNVPGKVGEISYFFTSEGIFLDWEPVSGAVGYYVYRSSTGSTGEYTDLTTDGITESDYLDVVTSGTYHYKVAAYNNAGVGTQSDVVSVSWPGGGTAPAKVTGVTAVSGSDGITISWGSVSGANSYHIYRSTGSSSGYAYLTSSTSSPYVDKSVASGTTYYYTVAAVNSGKFEGVRSDSASATAVGDSNSGGLSAPTGLTATPSVSSGNITLSWTGVNGASSYRVYRGTSSSGTYSQINTSTIGTSYTDSSVTAGQTYYYKVSAVSSGGNESPQSVYAFAAAVGDSNSGGLSAPTGLTATPSVSSDITLSWTAPAGGASSYKIYRGTSQSGTYSILIASGISATSYSVSGGTTTVYYSVSAMSSGNESTQSDSVAVLGTPSGLTTAASGSTITLTWTGVSGASSYKVYRSTSSSGTYTHINSSVTTTGTSYPDSSVTAGQTYYYKVSAVTSRSESLQSASVSATVLSAPTGLTAAASGSTITLNWTGVSGASSYRVYRSTSSSGTYTHINSSVTTTGTSYPDSSVTAGQTYYYKVSAVTSRSESLQSASVPATILSAPTGLTAAASGSSITLNWSSVTGASSYRVYRSTSSSGTYTHINSSVTTTGTSYPDSSVTAGQTYYYKVSAVSSGGGEGPQSANVSAIAVSTTALSGSSGTWYKYTLSSGVSANYYRFQSLSSYSTTLKWADTDGGATLFSPNLNLDIKVSAYYEDTGEVIFTGVDTGYSTGQTFYGTGRYVIVKVQPYSSGSYGSFALRYD